MNFSEAYPVLAKLGLPCFSEVSPHRHHLCRQNLLILGELVFVLEDLLVKRPAEDELELLGVSRPEPRRVHRSTPVKGTAQETTTKSYFE